MLRVLVAATFWTRLWGLHAYSAQQREYVAILLSPCRMVHTWGLSKAIDLVFLDRQGHFLCYLPSVQPYAIRFQYHAGAVLEAPAGKGLQAWRLLNDQYCCRDGKWFDKLGKSLRTTRPLKPY